MRFRIAALLAFLLACNGRERATPALVDTGTAHAASPATAPSAALTDSSCELAQVFAHPNADSLVAEFLRRDAAGQFLRTDSWFAGATECPAHEEGPDAYAVIAGYRTRQLRRTPDSLAVEVTSSRLGYVEGTSGFRSDSASVVDTVRAIRTTYGWRIAAPALRQFVVESAARVRGDLGPRQSDSAVR